MKQQLKLKDISYPKRASDTYKNKEWHSLIIWWSTWKTWAVILACKAASRAWAWLVTACISQDLNIAYEANLIEEMTCPVQNDKRWHISINWYRKIKWQITNFSSVLIGPWMWEYEKWSLIVSDLIRNYESWPIVIDADWINNIAEYMKKEELSAILKNKKTDIILTPHIWEFAKLFNEKKEDVVKKQSELAAKYSKKYWVYIILKWSETVIASPEWSIFISNIWTSALATAWSWDVLSGIVVALSWKKNKDNNLIELLKSAVVVHGLAWSIAWEKYWEQSTIASDIISCLSEAIKKIN